LINFLTILGDIDTVTGEIDVIASTVMILNPDQGIDIILAKNRTFWDEEIEIYQAQCLYFETVTQQWKPNGCVLTEQDENSFHCK
jgi:hypothetical protein